MSDFDIDCLVPKQGSGVLCPVCNAVCGRRRAAGVRVGGRARRGRGAGAVPRLARPPAAALAGPARAAAHRPRLRQAPLVSHTTRTQHVPVPHSRTHTRTALTHIHICMQRIRITHKRVSCRRADTHTHCTGTK